MVSEVAQLIASVKDVSLPNTLKYPLWIVAATLIGVIIKIWFQAYTEQLDRRRRLYAEALVACMEYREFPFVICRRDATQPHAERVRISEALRDVQKRINYHQAWLETESAEIAKAYNHLVTLSRALGGTEMQRLWQEKPIDQDRQMNIKLKIDLKQLEDCDRLYIEAVNRHLLPFWRKLFT